MISSVPPRVREVFWFCLNLGLISLSFGGIFFWIVYPNPIHYLMLMKYRPVIVVGGFAYMLVIVAYIISWWMQRRHLNEAALHAVVNDFRTIRTLRNLTQRELNQLPSDPEARRQAVLAVVAARMARGENEDLDAAAPPTVDRVDPVAPTRQRPGAKSGVRHRTSAPRAGQNEHEEDHGMNEGRVNENESESSGLNYPLRHVHFANEDANQIIEGAGAPANGATEKSGIPTRDDDEIDQHGVEDSVKTDSVAHPTPSSSPPRASAEPAEGDWEIFNHHNTHTA